MRGCSTSDWCHVTCNPCYVFYRAITPNTKVLILNSPHNPTGKVFTRLELEVIAAIVSRHPQLTVLSDEVYKYTIYNPLELGDSTAYGHTHFAALPDMWERTITISSCGKTFSATGWQVGWMIASSKYILPVQEILPCVQFCTASPMQEALRLALPIAEQPYEGHSSYYEYLRKQFVQKRQVLEAGLKAADITPLPSHGGYFLLGLLPQLPHLETFSEPYDWSYLRMLAHEKKVVGIPASPFCSAFYLPGATDRKASLAQWPSMARFAFCKKDSTLLEAQRRLMSPSSAAAAEAKLHVL
jgi:kynurenine--oxoglutarate transaminase/cysteine-S-conjugate beta-lyase/glutamine--phenylpyruvate transaminase